ncbi:MAG: hypothetical protein GXP27_13685 [Planctomycetes bacterium]|nr:hypothetical protein [Planctomycetota bacterium]
MALTWVIIGVGFSAAYGDARLAESLGSERSAGATAETQKTKPAVFAVRELYAPGHFGNSYEAMGEYEMRRLLAEAVSWGFNRYGDWFDMEDCADPFVFRMQLGGALWRRKKTNFLSAQALGLSCDLIITPNHVYTDQLRPELLAKKGQLDGRTIFGQLICPSKPQARALILSNYEKLFADLARSGVRLTALTAFAYDYGGCLCEKCQPWILTFARLTREIHAIARRYHPDIQLCVVGWWWKPKEHQQFNEWADREAPGLIHTFYLRQLSQEVPRGCQRGAFVHIGAADDWASRDIYGVLGPVIAADRIERTLKMLADQRVTHLMAYSEGAFDDVNKALVAGLSSGKFRTADEVLRAYAKRYFGADETTAARWAEWLKQWGRPHKVDTKRAGQTLAELLKDAPPPTWRRRQWELKQELFRLNQLIGTGEEWTPERLEAVNRFWQVHEQIHRGVWVLGPLRHMFGRDGTEAAVRWHKSWLQHRRAASASAR